MNEFILNIVFRLFSRNWTRFSFLKRLYSWNLMTFTQHFISTFFLKFNKFFTQNNDFISRNLTSLISHYNAFFLLLYTTLILFRNIQFWCEFCCFSPLFCLLVFRIHFRYDLEGKEVVLGFFQCVRSQKVTGQRSEPPYQTNSILPGSCGCCCSSERL